MTTVTTAATPARKPLYTSLLFSPHRASAGMVLGMAAPEWPSAEDFSDAF